MSSSGRSWTEREFEQFIASRGGIVTRAELLKAGWTADDLRIARGTYGRPTRLRRGWYCSRRLPTEVRRAWAHGGPLACVSALRWYGALAPSEPFREDDTVHVCLPQHARRRSVEALPPLSVIVHWHDVALDPGARWAVPLDVAEDQARHCRAAAAAAAAQPSRARSSPSRRAGPP